MRKETQFEKNVNKSIDEMKSLVIDFTYWNDENKYANQDAKIHVCKNLIDSAQKINLLAQKQLLIEVEKERKLKMK